MIHSQENNLCARKRHFQAVKKISLQGNSARKHDKYTGLIHDLKAKHMFTCDWLCFELTLYLKVSQC